MRFYSLAGLEKLATWAVGGDLRAFATLWSKYSKEPGGAKPWLETVARQKLDCFKNDAATVDFVASLESSEVPSCLVRLYAATPPDSAARSQVVTHWVRLAGDASIPNLVGPLLSYYDPSLVKPLWEALSNAQQELQRRHWNAALNEPAQARHALAHHIGRLLLSSVNTAEDDEEFKWVAWYQELPPEAALAGEPMRLANEWALLALYLVSTREYHDTFAAHIHSLTGTGRPPLFGRFEGGYLRVLTGEWERKNDGPGRRLVVDAASTKLETTTRPNEGLEMAGHVAQILGLIGQSMVVVTAKEQDYN